MAKVLRRYAMLASVCGWAAVLAGCDEISGSVDGEASLSFAVQGAPDLLGQATDPENPVFVSGHEIALTRVELRVSEVELEREDSLKIEWESRTTLVALPLDGRVETAFNANVMAATFDEFEMDVQTVRIQGTFDGEPFDVTVQVNDEIEIEFFPPLVIDETGEVNVTVAVIVENWFRRPGGGAIDPRNLDSSIESDLRNNIKASFDAFDDDDHDGRRG